MTVIENERGLAATMSGRPMKFTPERMDQIRNLVERGNTREQIAEIVGCTVNSLAVTCSKHGVSLRRPRDVVASDRPRKPIVVGLPRTAADVLEPPGGWPPGHPFHRGRAMDSKSPEFTLRISYGDRTYDLPITIDSHTLCELACAANMKGVKLPDMISQAIVAGMKEVTS